MRTEDSATGRMWEYTYDAIGNITSSTYTDEKGEKHSDTYKYDKDNLTRFTGEKVDGYSGGNPKTYLGYTLKWTHGRQLASATPTKKKTLADSSAQPVTYTYVYDGSRLSKTVGKTSKSAGTTTEYILNGSTILAQNTTYANGETETLNFYYNSDGKLIEIGYLKYDSADGGSDLKDATENHYSVIRNAMGDVAALYTADGTLVGTYEYDPYGLPLETTANTAYKDADGILEKNPFRYRGYYYDSETGWYYLQSRYYDPAVKRFINADSIDLLTNECINILQFNLYLYCNADPINNTDPSGCFSWDEVWDWFNEQSNKNHPIIFVNASANSATGASLVGSVQYVIDPIAIVTDPRHAIGEQVSGGFGLAAGASEKVGGAVGFLYARNISNFEGYGTEIGGSIAVGPGFSGGIIITGEATDETHYYGGVYRSRCRSRCGGSY